METGIYVRGESENRMVIRLDVPAGYYKPPRKETSPIPGVVVSASEKLLRSRGLKGVVDYETRISPIFYKLSNVQNITRKREGNSLIEKIMHDKGVITLKVENGSLYTRGYIYDNPQGTVVKSYNLLEGIKPEVALQNAHNSIIGRLRKMECGKRNEYVNASIDAYYEAEKRRAQLKLVRKKKSEEALRKATNDILERAQEMGATG